MANSLLEHETVESEEVMAILRGKPWPVEKAAELEPTTTTRSRHPSRKRGPNAQAPSANDFAGAGVTPKARSSAAFLFGFAAAPAAAQIPPGPTLPDRKHGMQYHVRRRPGQPSAAISLCIARRVRASNACAAGVSRAWRQ